MRQKLFEMVQGTVLFHTDEFIFVWSFKYANGRQNRSSGANATSGAGVVCNMVLLEGI